MGTLPMGTSPPGLHKSLIRPFSHLTVKTYISDGTVSSLVICRKPCSELDTDSSAMLAKFKEVQDKQFVEVRLLADVVAEAQQVWTTPINLTSSREAAGETIFAALFDSAPRLQSFFQDGQTDHGNAIHEQSQQYYFRSS